MEYGGPITFDSRLKVSSLIQVFVLGYLWCY